MSVFLAMEGFDSEILWGLVKIGSLWEVWFEFRAQFPIDKSKT